MIGLVGVFCRREATAACSLRRTELDSRQLLSFGALAGVLAWLGGNPVVLVERARSGKHQRVSSITARHRDLIVSRTLREGEEWGEQPYSTASSWSKPWENLSRITGRGSSSWLRQLVGEPRAGYGLGEVTFGSQNANTQTCRPNSGGVRGVLLAQDTLGLPHDNARPGRQADTDTPDHQPALRHLPTRMGVAGQLHRREQLPPQPRSSPCRAAADSTCRLAHLPGRQCRHLPGHRDGGVLLGIQ